ncbi:class I SAM-dependent methyltransferase [Heyndrickxia sp. NPDC080065]|uniref:class I SAM-dependent methyltransferase n=1 Tax=Heyndrickxia sp. NPDC080065 TaxID=3390568 RepID=UPI003CFD745A
MNETRLEEILHCMATASSNFEIQKVQTEHRLKLAECWGISEGSKVLEIGCGQGDTTAVLAHLVGKKGLVHGIDIASPDYGSPITLGDSIDYLKKSSLGMQIKVEFEKDILSPDVNFPGNKYDSVVLSHSSWYLKSFEELQGILTKLKNWGKKLCFAEWDTRVTSAEQLPHFLSVLIQAQYECFKNNSLANVRTLFTPDDIKKAVENARWNMVLERSINSPNLHDGKWEVEQTLASYEAELETVENMPVKLQKLIRSEITLLQSAIEKNTIKPMPTFVLIAE